MSSLSIRIDRLETANRAGKSTRASAEVLDAFVAQVNKLAAVHPGAGSGVTAAEAAAVMANWKTEWRALGLQAI